MPLRQLQFSFAFLLFACLHPLAFGQAYKCKDTGGGTIYQGAPCLHTEKVIKFQPEGGKSDDRIRLFLARVPYGISPEEVLRLLPGSKPEMPPSPEDGRKPHAVEIDSYTFAGKAFVVRFIFQSDGLTQVNLQEISSMEENVTTRAAFENIVSALRQTFGQESSQKIESRLSGLYGGADWQLNGTRVDVAIVPVTQHHSTILINYFSK